MNNCIDISGATVPQAGQVLSIALSTNLDLELVWCPPGEFMMGSPDNELGRAANEAQRLVTLTKGFWIGRYAVTQKQYEAVMGKQPSTFVWRSDKKDDNQSAEPPVECVYWDEAMAFGNEVKLPANSCIPSDYKLTLPTEAQWEYACRAGTISALNNGLELTCDEGKCDNLAQLGCYRGNSRGRTFNVGQYLPNAWGLYDMHGNVSEWCRDRYASSYSGSAIDPTGPSTGGSRVCRGGSWLSYAKYCRSASRFCYSPDARRYYLGFRVALASINSTSASL